MNLRSLHNKLTIIGDPNNHIRNKPKYKQNNQSYKQIYNLSKIDKPSRTTKILLFSTFSNKESIDYTEFKDKMKSFKKT